MVSEPLRPETDERMTTVSAIPAPVSGWLSVIRAVSRPSRLAFGVALLAVVSGFATYAGLCWLFDISRTRARLQHGFAFFRTKFANING